RQQPERSGRYHERRGGAQPRVPAHTQPGFGERGARADVRQGLRSAAPALRPGSARLGEDARLKEISAMALLGIDIGTSGTRALLIDETGATIASATAAYPLSTPRPGWAEQEPRDWWEATVGTVRQVLASSGVSAADVRGVGLSGQMHGSVFLDRDNQVLRPALLWCDQRTVEQCAWITQRVGAARVVELTSNPVLTGFTAPKIVWLRQH